MRISPGSAHVTSTNSPVENNASETADLERAPAFTLGTALAWLGHDCSGDCPSLVTDCRSVVWFAHLPGACRPTSIRTLVEVFFIDPAWAPASIADLLSEVNGCVRPNHIRVQLVTSGPLQLETALGATSA